MSAHFHKSGNGMFQALTCYSLGTFTSKDAGTMLGSMLGHSRWACPHLARDGAPHFADPHAAMAKAGDHQRAPSMYAHFDGYERRTAYHFLPPGEVKNPITAGMKGALAITDSGCRIL